MGLYLYI